MPVSKTPKRQELWRSKLGTDYTKEFMEQNERRLYKELQELRDLPGNRICADCGSKGSTVWASVNLGVFLCMTCGAHHRSLGTHISKPKGATGTYLWGPDEIAFMKEHGNIRAQEIYGKNTPPNGISKDDAFAWKQFLTDKYVHRKYAPTTQSTTLPMVTTTPPATPTTKLSSRISKTNTKFTNLPMPDIDLIHFGDNTPMNSPTTPAGRSTVKTATPKMVSPNQSDDFFANFGL